MCGRNQGGPAGPARSIRTVSKHFALGAVVTMGTDYIVAYGSEQQKTAPVVKNTALPAKVTLQEDVTVTPGVPD